MWFFGLLPQKAAAVQFIPIIQQGVVNSTTIGIPMGGGGVAGLQAFIISTIFPMFQTLFLALALIMLFWYAMQLLLESGEETTVTEAKQSYEYAIFGGAVVAFASVVVGSFGVGPGAAGTTLVTPGPITSAIIQFIIYLKATVSALVTVAIFIQGFRLIALQGSEGEMEKQKKQFFYTLVGVAMILLAEVVITAMQPPAGSGILSDEIAGIASFVLAIFGLMAVIAIVTGGGMLVMSVDESMKDRAKNIIRGAVIAIVVVLASYSLVTYVLTM